MKIENIEINIGIFGNVSVGKSSLVNCILGKKLSEIGCSKTTFVPQAYTNFGNREYHLESIRHLNEMANDQAKIINSTDKIKHVMHYIDKFELLEDSRNDIGNKIDSMFKIIIWDMPGFDTTHHGNMYLDWLSTNIKIFDIIVYVTEIMDDNLTMFDMLVSYVRKYDIKMVCVVNKCDNMKLDKDTSVISLGTVDHDNRYIKINNIMANYATQYSIGNNNYITPFLPISVQNYEYFGNKLLFKDYDNDFGFEILTASIINAINNHKLYFAVKHINRHIKVSKPKSMIDIIEYSRIIRKCNVQSQFIDISSGYNLSKYNLSENFWNLIKDTITSHASKIVQKCVKIVNDGKNIGFRSFDDVNIDIQVFLSFINSVEIFKDFDDYPNNLVEYYRIKVISNLLNIYDAIANFEYINQHYLDISNIFLYLELIKEHMRTEFDNYALKFIYTHRNIKIFESHYQESLIDVLKFIANNLSCCLSRNKFTSIVCMILINKQLYMKSKSNYVQYIISVKKLIKSIIVPIIKVNYVGPLDILIETTKKNVSIAISDNRLSSFYKQDINMFTVNNQLNNFYLGDTFDISVDFEKNLLELVKFE